MSWAEHWPGAVGLARRWGLRAAPACTVAGTEAGNPNDLLRRNARTGALARVLLALGSALVLYLDPSGPSSGGRYAQVAAATSVLLIIAYSFWVWWLESSRLPLTYLPRLTTCLDVVFSAALIASTGGYRSPFYLWNVFTIVAAALRNGWLSAVRVGVAQFALYIVICLPGVGQADFLPGAFLVRTAYLLVIALVLAYMGQRLLEQNRMLAGLDSAATYMSAGRSILDILARFADSAIELLQAEQVAVGVWDEGAKRPLPVLANLEREQGEQLLRLARDSVAAAPATPAPVTLRSNTPEHEPRFDGAREALAGIQNLLITRLPGSGPSVGVLVACNRQGGRGFTAADQALAELLSAQAGPLLETARLQDQQRYSASVDERRRIAAELHDGLIQTLATIDLRSLLCSQLWCSQQWEPLGEELGLLKRLSEDALVEARGTVNELAPVLLREEGLAVYLEDCVHKFQARMATPVEASVELAAQEVPEPTALLLIGLLREGLNNVRKHAQATHVTLLITQRGDEITFRLADDGVGFSPEESPWQHSPTRHCGLAYMRERLTAVGGELRVSSRPGEGTVLEARLPLLTEQHLVS